MSHKKPIERQVLVMWSHSSIILTLFLDHVLEASLRTNSVALMVDMRAMSLTFMIESLLASLEAYIEHNCLFLANSGDVSE